MAVKERQNDLSYTLTLDVPQKEAAYVERGGLRFRNELNALVLAFVTARMQADSKGPSKASGMCGSEGARLSGLDLFNALRASAPILDDEEMHIFDRVTENRKESK